MWKYGNRDVDLMMKLDAAGDVIGSVIYDISARTFYCLNADGKVIGKENTEAAAKALVDAATN